MDVVWDIDLSGLIGKMVAVETRAGHFRQSVLTRVDYVNFEISGYTCGLPHRLVLDGDQELSFHSLVSIRPVTLSKKKEAAG